MIEFFKSNAIFKDRQAVWLMSTGSLLALIIVAYVFALVESRDFKVDVRFSGYDRTLSDKGEWYTLYVFPVFAVVSHLLNSYLALKSYQIQRMLAMVILSLNVVLMVFIFMVSRALIGLL